MPRRLSGKVVSNKMDKTIVVAVERKQQHRLYRRQYKITKKFLVHDPENKYEEGDFINIKESRPLSRRKRWVVDSVASKGSRSKT